MKKQETITTREIRTEVALELKELIENICRIKKNATPEEMIALSEVANAIANILRPLDGSF